MPDQHRVVQVEGFDQVRQVIGLGVHVVAGQACSDRPWPRRSWAMAR
jgi:hypothetical protein